MRVVWGAGLICCAGAAGVDCWNAEFTREDCCSDPPVKDCWMPTLGLTRRTCCERQEIDVRETMARYDRMREAALRAIHALGIGEPAACSAVAGRLLAELEGLGVRTLPWQRRLFHQTLWREDRLCKADPANVDRLAVGLAAPLLNGCSAGQTAYSCGELGGAFLLHAQRFWSRVYNRTAEEFAVAARRGADTWASTEPFDIAMVASVGRPAFGRKALAGIRSALFHARSRPLRFHLVVDAEGEADMRRALETLEPWLRARGEFLLYAGERLDIAWGLVHAMVPEDCLRFEKRYGSPGWLRLFAHEIVRLPSVRALLWVDAGDFVFFDDPAGLLAEHARFREGHIVAAPVSHMLPFQLFDLHKMRTRGWTRLVFDAFRSGYAEYGVAGFCPLGEGGLVGRLSESEASLHVWHWFPSSWSYEPWDIVLNGWGVNPEKVSLPLVWEWRPYAGVETFASMRVFCPSFAEAVAGLAAQGEFSEAEMSAIASHASYQQHSRWINETFFDEKGQRLTCGERVRGAHFVLPFHSTPWAHRVLNFWAGADVWNADWNKGRDLRV